MRTLTLLWCTFVLAASTLAVRPCRAATPTTLTPAQLAACKQLSLDTKQIAELADKPLYKFTESEVDAYLRFLSATEPDLRKRILHLAQEHQPALRAVPVGRNAVRAVRSAAHLLPG